MMGLLENILHNREGFSIYRLKLILVHILNNHPRAVVEAICWIRQREVPLIAQ